MIKYINLKDEKIAVQNIFCIGLNYEDHIEEMKSNKYHDLVTFMKPTTSINNSLNIVLPSFSKDIHYETEVVVLIGKDANNISSQDASNYIKGYGIGLDLTARDIQINFKSRGLPWLKSKGFKGAAVLSEFITADRIKDNTNIQFSLNKNNELTQEGNTANMIFPIDNIIASLSEVYGLQEGDIIFTGTPAGTGKLNHGDILNLKLENLIQTEFKVVNNNVSKKKSFLNKLKNFFK